MSDLDQQLRDLLSEKAATVGPPPPLPDGLREVATTGWWRRRPQWLLVPAAALITGAVVIPVALINQNAGVTAMPSGKAQAWAEQVCADRPSEPSPAQPEVVAMTFDASAVCWWENPAHLGDDTVGLQRVTALSPAQITTLQDLLSDAARQQPTCSMIDSPPQVEYYVFLRDSGGQGWRINIPEPPCLGFEMTGGQYRSAVLVNWLRSLPNTEESPAIDLVQSGACGDAFFWAASADGETAVTVDVTYSRPADAQGKVTIPFTAPGNQVVRVEVLTGADLSRNFCTDVIDMSSQPDTRSAAVAGQGRVTIAIPPRDGSGCGRTLGSLDLSGLVAADGTEFSPITVESRDIGCYSG
jgi:hypothetical protein